MKIVTLSGENLASLCAPFTIDFAQGILADAGLFAICGNTGAGKSTLLDAICLSLFDAMPRFNNSRRGPNIGHAQSEASERLKSNDVRNIMTRGAGSCVSQVIFELENGLRYQATWRLKRARGSATGRFQAQEMELLDCKTGQVLAVKKTEVLAQIEALIGLNYDQFRRSVLLAQGDFAAFLKAPAKERSDLLERITGTQLYSTISKLAFNTAKESEHKLKELQSKLGEVSLLPESEQQALAQKIGFLNESIEKSGEQQIQLQWLEQTLEQQLSTIKQLDEGKVSLTQVQEKAAEQAHVNELLEQIDLAQDAKVVYAQLQQNKLEHQALVTQSQTTQQALTKQQELVTQTQQQRDKLSDLQNKAQQDYEQKLPQVELAITRQNDLRHLNEKITQQHQQLGLLKEQQHQVVAKVAHNNQKLEEKQHRINHLAQFIAQHQQMAPLINNLVSIEQGIKDFQSLEQQSAQHNEKNKDNELQHKALETQLSNDGQQKQTLALQQHKLQQQLQQYAQVFEQANLEQLEQQQATQEQQLIDWTRLLQLVKQGLEYLAMLEKKEHQKDDIARNLEQLRAQYQQVKQAQHQHQPVLAEAQRSLNQARNVMSLHDHRMQLVDGEACALCGAKEHPYANEQNIGDVLVEQLNDRCIVLTQEGNDLANQLTKLDAIGQEQAALQKNLLEEIAQLNETITTLGCPQISLPYQAELEANIANLTQEAEQLKTHYQATVSQVEQARKVEQELTQVEHDIALVDQAIESAHNRVAAIKSEQILNTQYIQQFEGQMHLAIEKLIHLYPQANWPLLLNEPQQLVLYVEELTADVQRFAENSNEHQELTQQVSQLQQNNVMLNEQEHQITLQVKPLDNQLDADKLTLEQWTIEIEQLTQGIEPNKLKQDLVEQVTQLAQALQNAQQALHSSNNELSVLVSKVQQSEQQIQLVLEQAGLLAKQWLDWQRELDLTEDKLVSLLSHEPSWIVETKKQYASLQQNLHQHQAVIEQLERQIEQVNLKLYQRDDALLELMPDLAPLPSKSTSEQRKMVAQSLTAKQACFNQDLFDLRSQLEQHNKAMIQFGQLQQAIDTQTHETSLWLEMKELIGSADGAKFRTFAQSLTLQQMLVSANYHLSDLAPRYQLQAVPSSELDLQIIDLDMGDEVRSIDSLSGGESFLVSLALALGLGSITSLQTSINTLFIDEGFGTLDPDTLEVALSCLDSLQATGRQIGLISHVQGLVERVGTRIQITAQGSGESRIEVLAR